MKMRSGSRGENFCQQTEGEGKGAAGTRLEASDYAPFYQKTFMFARESMYSHRDCPAVGSCNFGSHMAQRKQDLIVLLGFGANFRTSAAQQKKLMRQREADYAASRVSSRPRGDLLAF